MIDQTIALFRYQLLGIINLRILLLLCGLLSVAFLGSRFIAELAILNSDTIALAVVADFLRYSLILLLIISICHQVSQDYELTQFDRLLAMPVARWQYVLAQFMVLLVFALTLMLPVFLLMLLLGNLQLASYWSLATLIEMLLVGQFALLAIISLEKLPVAVIFTIAIYLLAKLTPLIALILTQSSHFYEEEKGFQLAQTLFDAIQYVLPGFNAFAQNDVLFEAADKVSLLSTQLLTVVVYSGFIQFVILIDFYRKELGRA